MTERDPATIAELKDMMQASRDRLSGLLSQLSDEEMSVVDPESGWAIKDHLVHIACWEVGIAALLQGRDRWAAMGVDEDTRNRVSMDQLNDLICEQNRNLTADDARVTLEGAHREMMTALEGLTDDDLQRPYSHFLGQPPGEDTRPIINWIAGNTYGHYDEHSEWIAAYLARQASRG